MPRGINDFDAARIQGRNLSDANTVNVVSPSPVIDGLITHYDAANYYSYPITGSTWYDQGFLRNNATLNGSMAYTRTGTGAMTNGSTLGYALATNTLISKNCSICMWIRVTSTPGNYTGVFSLGLSSSRIEYGDTTVPTNYYWYSGGFVNGTFLFSHSSAQYDFIVLSFDASNATCYKNGVQTAQSVSSNFDTATNMIIGSRATGQNHWQGSISIFSVYNRPLSQQEALQLFNASRARFNV